MTEAKKTTTETDVSTKKESNASQAKKTTRKLRQNEISRDTDVVIKNNLVGRLVYICPKNHTKYVLDGYGAIDEMPIDELIQMRNLQRKFLERYWVVIDSVSTDKYTVDEILEALRLKDLYEGDHSVMLDVDKFILGNISTLKSKFPKLNKYAQTIILKRASELYKNGEMSKLDTYTYLSNQEGAGGLFN